MSPALRLGRREILVHPWRSLLVLLLIGLPILVSVSAATLLETSSVDAREALPAQMGMAAVEARWVDAPDQPASSVGEAAAKLRGATDQPVVEVTRSRGWLAYDATGRGVSILGTDWSSPLAAGLSDLTDGRTPTRRGEVGVTPDLARRGLGIGAHATLGDERVTVVGIVHLLQAGGDVTSDGVILPPNATAQGADTSTFLVGRAGRPFDRSALEKAGFEVTTRAQVLSAESSSMSSEDTQLIALLVVCLLIEITLLAGPAFAVGVRRQRRTLALVAVAGGSPRDIRRAILSQAVILGLGASVLGALLSVPFMWLSLRVYEVGWGTWLGPFDIGWVAVVPAILLGTLSAVMAVALPAWHASKADVVTALAGRQPTPRVWLGWPLAGLLVLALGTVGSLWNLGHAGGDFTNAWWAIVSVCGAVLMTPWLIATIAKLAPRLPLPLRLALRDADRHRTRSAPAIAAVMASVSAVVALGLGSSSDAKQTDRDWQYAYPLGTVTLSAEADAMPAIVSAVKERTGITLTPLDTLANWQVEPPEVAPDDWSSWSAPTSVAIADSATLAGWGITLDDAARTALDSGKGLVDSSAHESGAVAVRDWSTTTGDTEPTPVEVPAVATDLRLRGRLPEGAVQPTLAGLVVSPATAAKLRLVDTDDVEPWITAIADRSADALGSRGEDAVRGAVATVDQGEWNLSVTTRHRSTYWLVLLLLTVLGAFTVLLGTFSATGLALDDARLDMATLSAVGARPRTRRIAAGAHAAVIAFVGAVLGIAVGFTPGMAAAYLLTSVGSDGWILVVPWPLLGVLLVGLPLLAGATTAAVHRTRVQAPGRAA
ncbi:ABC transporter permease [Nocardioides sp. Kera G14]|uniref:ABC transporter permease n=1 Tax=Nocardioides sp. Kera G14 TaxID=2884264 RepID=UPI001D10A90F|nr:ABC transporter permease [Nocardioides sp. Kera G14]UDY24737.1 ABC transporter permease [Nocardioides sp. Kera G14]